MPHTHGITPPAPRTFGHFGAERGRLGAARGQHGADAIAHFDTQTEDVDRAAGAGKQHKEERTEQ
jgi:hypothetical protein